MKDLICAIDIGSSKIKILVCQKKKTGIEAIFFSEEPSEGVKRGVIVNSEKVSKTLKKLLFRAQENLKTKINSAYLNLGGTHLFSLFSRGLVSVSRADQVISEEDVERAIKEAKAIGISQNKEIFDFIPREFIVDGEKEIKEPIGLKGKRLEVEGLALGCFSPYLEKIKEVAFGVELEILDLIPSPLASARAVLNEKQKENGICLLDIGAETTSLVIFENGSLVHLAILPVGSTLVTNQIAINFKIEPEIAEQIKTEFGTLIFKGKNLRQKIDLGEEEPLIFYQRGLTRIIQQKYLEIFLEVKKELKKIQKEINFPAGIILVGGGAKIPKIADFAKEKFHLFSRLGKPSGIINLEDDPSLAVVAGLILCAHDLELEGKVYETKSKFFSKIKKFLKIFLP